MLVVQRSKREYLMCMMGWHIDSNFGVTSAERLASRQRILRAFRVPTGHDANRDEAVYGEAIANESHIRDRCS